VTLPNFLVIGAAKSGTDALCKYLGEHPDIYMCPNREPNFFVAEGQNEIPFRGPGDRAAFEAMDGWVSSLERYEGLFAGVAGEKAIGEGTAWYIYFEEAAARIKRYIGDAKLIAVLRNPVDRAYSAYTMLLRDGRETIFDFPEALAAESERRQQNWDPLYHYVDMGFYARQLRHYQSVFADDQLRTIVYDDFNTRPVEVMQDIFRFLGVDERFVPDTSKRHNMSMVPRSRAAHQVVMGRHPLKQALKSVLPTGFRRGLKHTFMNRNLTRPAPLAPEVRAQLVEVFRADILELQDMIGHDLSAWLR
jgi:hypothetical protein